MRPARSIRIALFIALAAAVLAAGCAYTTVAVREKPPAPGPVIAAGLTAAMPAVADSRSWPTQATYQPIPNVRIFSEEITGKVRSGLVESGLFARLDPPAEASGGLPAPAQPRLVIAMKSFVVTNLGNNAWVAPHLALNGALLPVFSGVLVASKGLVDSGAYLLPSTRLGTSLGAKVQYFEPGLNAPVLDIDYLVKVEMDSVSERSLLRSLEKGETYGVEIGKAEGHRTLDLFVQTVARDARWAYLPEFRRLAKAESRVNEVERPSEKVKAASGVLDLVKPLTFTEEEVKILRDGFLDSGPRASIANEMLAKFKNLPSAKELPPDQTISEEQAVKLFDDPALLKAEVESVMASRALGLAVKVMTGLLVERSAPALAKKPAAVRFPAQPAMAGRPDPEAQPEAEAEAPKTKAEKAAAANAALAAGLAEEIASRVKQDPRLQSLLIDEAEKAVGPAWAPMHDLLRKVDSPSTKKYLEMRAG